jgi:hypothetical protein
MKQMNFLSDIKIKKGLNDKEIRNKFVNNVQRRITVIHKAKLQNEFSYDLSILYRMKNDPSRYIDTFVEFV